MAYTQAPAFCVQVEFTEGCNLQCTFCGLQGIREKAGGPYKFMTMATAERVASELARCHWNSRIEFAMHGEPSMHPQFIDLVAVFRKHLPRNQIMMTSNGAGFLKDTDQKIKDIFAAGLNILALDDYETVNIVPKVLDRWRGDKEIPAYSYPEDGLELSPHRRWPRGTNVIIVIEDIAKAKKGSHAVITNHAGCGSPPNQSKAGQRCAKPFRELGVRWDGKIAGCCNDWRGIYKVGDLTKTSLDELWNGERFGAMRKKLYHGQRDFGACDGCDYSTYRNGLLPDMLGKKTLPKPNAKDMEVVKQATARATYSPIVLRPWEKKK